MKIFENIETDVNRNAEKNVNRNANENVNKNADEIINKNAEKNAENVTCDNLIRYAFIIFLIAFRLTKKFSRRFANDANFHAFESMLNNMKNSHFI